MVKEYLNEIPNWIDEDDMFLFHGTSNISEVNLDAGKYSNFSFFSMDLVERIINIYNKMSWYGIHGGGFAVLNSFSNTDLHPEKGKYFFLGESIQRCSLYASKDFAGGELVRSIFYSIGDLLKYLIDIEVREKHNEEIDIHGKYTNEKNQYDLETLKKEIQSLLPFYEKAQEIRNAYHYGIVYCFKIQQSQFQQIEYRNGMGLFIKGSLPVENLKAKLVFNDSYILNNLYLDKHFYNNRSIIWKLKLSNSDIH